MPHLESIPVIIAARDKQAEIGHTLDVLSMQSRAVEPIVVVNGGSAIDRNRTADIALQADVTVLESGEGKVLALQAGLRFLDKRALEPVLVLDADSRPLSRQWSRRFEESLHGLPSDTPALVWGQHVLTSDINWPLGVLLSAMAMRVSWTDQHKDRPRTIRGGNMGLRVTDDEALEKLLSLPNYWPREDVAIFDTLKEHGANHEVLLTPAAWVSTSGYRISDTLKRLITSHKHPSKVSDDSYAADAPANSKPYHSDTTRTVVHDE